VYIATQNNAAKKGIRSFRHFYVAHPLSRLGEAGADVFSIMRIAGHSSVTTSQKYVHPTPEGLERAFERLQHLNTAKFERAEAAEQGGSKAPGSTGSPQFPPQAIGRRVAKAS
jgi:hypothetical protein